MQPAARAGATLQAIWLAASSGGDQPAHADRLAQDAGVALGLLEDEVLQRLARWRGNGTARSRPGRCPPAPSAARPSRRRWPGPCRRSAFIGLADAHEEVERSSRVVAAKAGRPPAPPRRPAPRRPPAPIAMLPAGASVAGLITSRKAGGGGLHPLAVDVEALQVAHGCLLRFVVGVGCGGSGRRRELGHRQHQPFAAGARVGKLDLHAGVAAAAFGGDDDPVAEAGWLTAWPMAKPPRSRERGGEAAASRARRFGGALVVMARRRLGQCSCAAGWAGSATW